MPTRMRRTLSALLCLLAVGIAGPVLCAVTGSISGTVTDDETGKHLSGVNIVIQGTGLTTVTDDRGYFVITNVPPGTHVVTAELIGYSPSRRSNIGVTMDVTTTVDFALLPTVIEVPGPEVEVRAPRMTLHTDTTPTVYEVTAREERFYPSQPNDLYQWPGVTLGQPGVTADAFQDIHIRGGRVDQVGYMLEGIPLTEPSSNLFATSLTTVGLHKMQLFTGGYSAEYGNALSGLANQVVKTGDMMGSGNIELSAGVPWDYQGLRLEAGDATDQLSWYFDTYLWSSGFRGIYNLDSLPSAIDGVTKIVYRPGGRTQFTFLGLGGRQHYILGPKTYHTLTWDEGANQAVPTELEPDNARQSYQLAALALTHTFSPKSFLDLRLHSFRNRFPEIDALSGYFDGPYDVWYARRVNLKGYQLNYTNALSPSHMLKTGLRFTPSHNFALDAIAPDLEGMGPFPRVRQRTTDTRLLEAYVQDHWRPTPGMTMDLGVRYDRAAYMPDNYPSFSRSTLSPRFGVTYGLSDDTMLRMSHGRYTQMPGSLWTEVQFVGNDPAVNAYWQSIFAPISRPVFERAWNTDLGVERRIGGDTKIGLTAFRRQQDSLVQYYAPDPMQPGYYANIGRLDSYGLESKIERNQPQGWSGWLSYTWMRTKTNSSNTGDPLGTLYFSSPSSDIFFPASWEARHSLTAVMTRKLGDWEVTPWAQYLSGYPFGMGLDALPHPMTGAPLTVYGPDGQVADAIPNSYRTDPFATFNLNISKQVDEDRSVFLSVYNLFDTKKVMNYSAYDAFGVNPIGYNPPDAAHPGDPDGYYTYKPTVTVPPFNVRIGVRAHF